MNKSRLCISTILFALMMGWFAPVMAGVATPPVLSGDLIPTYGNDPQGDLYEGPSDVGHIYPPTGENYSGTGVYRFKGGFQSMLNEWKIDPSPAINRATLTFDGTYYDLTVEWYGLLCSERYPGVCDGYPNTPIHYEYGPWGVSTSGLITFNAVLLCSNSEFRQSNFSFPAVWWNIGNGVIDHSDFITLAEWEACSNPELLILRHDVSGGSTSTFNIPAPSVSWVASTNLGPEVVAVCGNGILEAGEECDDGNTTNGDCCSSVCLFEASGSSCGSQSNTECDNPDTCDGSGTCQDNYELATVTCGDAGTECTNQDYCDGAGGCTDNGYVASGSSCGSQSNTECDNPDTCDGSGTCQDNHEPDASACGDTGTECTNQDTCLAGSCVDNGYQPGGTTCGDPSNTECTNPDTCDGSGSCLDNHEPVTTTCGDAGTECTNQDYCDGTGGCTDNGFQNEFTPCGDSADTECTNPDSCDAVGQCDPRHEPDTTTCGDSLTECIAQDYCGNYTGECEDYGLTACGLIHAGGCPVDQVPAKSGSDFKLLFTADVQNWEAFKLNASNPGQIFYTLVSEPDVNTPATAVVFLPFPFVTQGSMSLHVYDADDVATNPLLPGCLFTDPYSGQGMEVSLTMDTFWDASNCDYPTDVPTQPGVLCFEEGMCPSDYDPPADALGECLYYYPIAVPEGGQFVAEWHLDHGLKGKWLDTYCPDDSSFDRFLPGAIGDYGDFDAVGIDINADAGETGCDIPSCVDHPFAHLIVHNEDEESSSDYDEIANVNIFKNPAGVFGRVYCNGNGYEGLEVKLLLEGEVLMTATTDEDGMYGINYSHKGKAAYYEVQVWSNGTPLVTTGPDDNIPLQSKGFAEQDFYNTPSDTVCNALDTTWVADDYDIPKGRFKTSP